MITDYNQFYNQLANQYKKAKEQPWRTRIELFSLMNLIGDLAGKKVIDVACGDGWLTRELRKAGASEVVGIEYRVQDARGTGPQEEFDLSVSNWLLVYAHNRDELGVMCRGLARQIKSGGRFVTLTTNPELYTWQSQPPDYRKYGFEARLPESTYEGAPVVLTVHLDEESIAIEDYFLPIEAHELALRDAGFRDVAFHKVKLSPGPQAREEGDYWDHFLQFPLMVMIDGIKA
jgi:SAM-dependent methyltransferase